MTKPIIEPTTQVCPSNKAGGVHHLTPRYLNGKMVMGCLTCKKTEAELRNGD